jgi:hypothetical protein
MKKVSLSGKIRKNQKHYMNNELHAVCKTKKFITTVNTRGIEFGRRTDIDRGVQLHPFSLGPYAGGFPETCTLIELHRARQMELRSEKIRLKKNGLRAPPMLKLRQDNAKQ